MTADCDSMGKGKHHESGMQEFPQPQVSFIKLSDAGWAERREMRPTLAHSKRTRTSLFTIGLATWDWTA